MTLFALKKQRILRDLVDIDSYQDSTVLERSEDLKERIMINDSVEWIRIEELLKRWGFAP